MKKTIASIALASLLSVPAIAFAQSGTYIGPGSAWTAGTSWQNGTVANGAGNTATFDRTTIAGGASVSISGTQTIGAVIFSGSNSGAKSFSITGSGTLVFDGGGQAALLSTSANGSTGMRTNIMLASDLNLQAMPQTPAGVAVDTFFGFYNSISNIDDSQVRTITTLTPEFVPPNPNNFRIVFSGDIRGNIRIVHNSGTNLNIQPPTAYTGGLIHDYYGGIVLKSGNFTSTAFGSFGLGADNNVVYFEAKDANSGAANAMLSFTGNPTVSSAMLTANQNMVLNADGRMNVSLSAGATASLTWAGQISGTGDFYKQGTSKLILTNNTNSYTGKTIVEQGTITTGADYVIDAQSALVMKAGTVFDLKGFNQALQSFTLQGNATIDLGSTGTIIFGDSSSMVWSNATLNIIGTFIENSSVRFGTSAAGLTADQLAKITINGQEAFINSNGYLSLIPEPAAAASVLGALGLAMVAITARRRR